MKRIMLAVLAFTTATAAHAQDAQFCNSFAAVAAAAPAKFAGLATNRKKDGDRVGRVKLSWGDPCVINDTLVRYQCTFMMPGARAGGKEERDKHMAAIQNCRPSLVVQPYDPKAPEDFVMTDDAIKVVGTGYVRLFYLSVEPR